ncbi:collagen-like protein, partial [Salmonella enterica subsp. enterica serovar Kokomlemle]|nr:collagen-like protein [Salmonella enterica subsp. enterica serovar Kokomlemle]
DPGPKGDPGEKGDQGPKGDPGADGKSAYEIWTEQQPAGSDTSMAAYMKFQEGKTAASGTDDVKKNDIPAYLTREKLEYGADLDLLIGDDKEGIYPLDNTIPENTPASISGNPLSGSLQVRNLGDIFLQELTTSGHGIWIRFCQTGSPGDWQLITVTGDPTVTGYQPGDYILGWINGDDNSLIYSDGTIASGYILTSASFQEEPLSGTWKVMGKRCISYPSSGSAHLTLDPILFKRIA